MNIKLLVFDQLWKTKGFGTEDGVERMTHLFNWGRELAKEVAPVIAVHQLGGDAENKKWASQNDLYGTKTGGPGEADLIIAMGRTMEGHDTRYFWAPKNKMLTPGDPKTRNAKWEAIIDHDRARFKEPRN